MKNKPNKVKQQGYMLTWDGEVPLYGDEPLDHDFVAVIGFALVPRAQYEELGAFKEVRHALVTFERGVIPVQVARAVGSKAWLKSQLAHRIKEQIDMAYEGAYLNKMDTKCKKSKT